MVKKKGFTLEKCVSGQKNLAGVKSLEGIKLEMRVLREEKKHNVF